MPGLLGLSAIWRWIDFLREGVIPLPFFQFNCQFNINVGFLRPGARHQPLLPLFVEPAMSQIPRLMHYGETSPQRVLSDMRPSEANSRDGSRKHQLSNRKTIGHSLRLALKLTAF